MKKKYMTVVFEYEEGAALPGELTKAFASDDKQFHDTKVTAVSMENEIARVEQLEDQVNGIN